MVQHIKQTTWNRNLFGIVNAHGDPWTYRVWGAAAAAQAHLDACKGARPELDKHRVVPISITVRVPKHQQK